MHKELSGIKES